MVKNQTVAEWASAKYNARRAEKSESECDKLRAERDYYRKDNDRLINALAIEHNECQRMREVLTYARQALDTLGIGKRTREEAMRLIDEVMK